MRLRRIARAATAALLSLTVTACGGPGVDDFCEQYLSTAEVEPEDGAQVREVLEELADRVPDEAGDEVREAAEHMVEAFPEDGDLAGALEAGELSEQEAEEFFAAADTVFAYGDGNCGD
ncbi:hypothetical protein [Blastococcus sp. SYSU DS0973]